MAACRYCGRTHQIPNRRSCDGCAAELPTLTVLGDATPAHWTSASIEECTHAFSDFARVVASAIKPDLVAYLKRGV